MNPISGTRESIFCVGHRMERVHNAQRAGNRGHRPHAAKDHHAEGKESRGEDATNLSAKSHVEKLVSRRAHRLSLIHI